MTPLIRTGIISALLLGASTALALKHAPPQYRVEVDPSIPAWTPGAVVIEPEEEFNVVGADVMDEITLAWIKRFRAAYPQLSVTLEARASGSGGPALVAGRAHAAPVGRELLPAEEQAFIAKFGYPPLAIRVATGSVSSLGKTAATVILVHKDNPIEGLTLAQLDAIYSTTRRRGHVPINTWGDLGVKGILAGQPVKLYGLKPPNGIERFFNIVALQGGNYREGIQYVKSEGFTHAFTFAANDMARNTNGLTYALLANVTPDVKVVPVARNAGEPFVAPTLGNVASHAYPLSRYVYIFVNRAPGKALDPKTREFLKLVLSREGQQAVSDEGVYIPLRAEVVREELAKLE